MFLLPITLSQEKKKIFSLVHPCLFPHCSSFHRVLPPQADHLLTLAPVVQTERPRLIGGAEQGGSGIGGRAQQQQQQPRQGDGDDEAELRRAMAMSMQR